MVDVETELAERQISEEEIDLVWSVFSELIRVANSYLREDED
jgi:hypothetical protein